MHNDPRRVCCGSQKHLLVFHVPERQRKNDRLPGVSPCAQTVGAFAQKYGIGCTVYKSRDQNQNTVTIHSMLLVFSFFALALHLCQLLKGLVRCTAKPLNGKRGRSDLLLCALPFVELFKWCPMLL